MTTAKGKNSASEPTHTPLRRISEEEFLTRCDESDLAEWVDGEVVLMTPVSVRHGRVRQFLSQILTLFVEEKDLGLVLGEPVQVRLPDQRRRRAPDVFFVARSRLDILRASHVEGPPDLVIEVVSPESRDRDRYEKFVEYESAGVREYWVVDPEEERLEAFTRSLQGRFELIPENAGVVASIVCEGFFVEAQWLWRDPPPKTRRVLEQLGLW